MRLSVLTNFKIFRNQCWTREQSWEYHINWNLQFVAHVSIGQLNGLDFGSCENKKNLWKIKNKIDFYFYIALTIAREIFGTAASFHSNQLHIN